MFVGVSIPGLMVAMWMFWECCYEVDEEAEEDNRSVTPITSHPSHPHSHIITTVNQTWIHVSLMFLYFTICLFCLHLNLAKLLLSSPPPPLFPRSSSRDTAAVVVVFSSVGGGGDVGGASTGICTVYCFIQC